MLSPITVEEIIKQCPNLHHLDLWGCPMISTESFLAITESSLHLKTFCFELSQEVEPDMYALLVKNHPEIEVLWIGYGSQLDDKTAAEVIRSLHSLRELHLGNAPEIGDLTFQAIAEVGYPIQHLSFDDIPNLSEGQFLETIRSLPEIYRLTLCGNTPFSSETLQTIAGYSPKLSQLMISVDKETKPSDVRYLKQQLLQLRKLYFPGSYGLFDDCL